MPMFYDKPYELEEKERQYFIERLNRTREERSYSAAQRVEIINKNLNKIVLFRKKKIISKTELSDMISLIIHIKNELNSNDWSSEFKREHKIDVILSLTVILDDYLTSLNSEINNLSVPILKEDSKKTDSAITKNKIYLNRDVFYYILSFLDTRTIASSTYVMVSLLKTKGKLSRKVDVEKHIYSRPIDRLIYLSFSPQDQQVIKMQHDRKRSNPKSTIKLGDLNNTIRLFFESLPKPQENNSNKPQTQNDLNPNTSCQIM